MIERSDGFIQNSPFNQFWKQQTILKNPTEPIETPFWNLIIQNGIPVNRKIEANI
jgi:hypothetical protein